MSQRRRQQQQKKQEDVQNDQERDATSASNIDVVGGDGAINEKKRQYRTNYNNTTENDSFYQTSSSSSQKSYYDPIHIRSHLWHSLEGLDRYPNYLSRWSVDDMNRFEEGLEAQLGKVREQKKRIIAQRNEMNQFVQQYKEQLQQKTIRENNGKENDNEQQQQEEETKTNKKEEEELTRLLLKQPSEMSWEDIRKHILDPRLSKAVFGSKMFRQNNNEFSLIQVLNGEVQVELDEYLLEDLMDEEMYDVYSLPLLSCTFCKFLKNYVKDFSLILDSKNDLHDAAEIKNNQGKESNDSRQQYQQQQQQRQTHKQKHHLHTLNLDNIDLGWLNDLLFHLIIRPISRQIFLQSDTIKDLDWRNGYIAGYSAKPTGIGKPRQKLIVHTDDSEVTCNVCLSDEKNDFRGGLLEFYGLRGINDQEGKLTGTYQPQMGKAILHSGRHFHSVTTVTSGDRYAYVIWSRSWKGSRKRYCPCCWLNNRGRNKSNSKENHSCICGARWN